MRTDTDPTPDQGSDAAPPAFAAPAARRAKQRRMLGAVAAVACIGVAIWLLQPGHAFPLQGRQRSPVNEPSAAFSSTQPTRLKLGAAGGSGPKIGEPAPEFTLLDVNGKVTRLSDFRGKTVLLNFWATWCIPCRQEFPLLTHLYDARAGEGLVVLAVDLQEEPEPVRKFAAGFDATFPIVIDAAGDVARQYRLVGPPTTFFIDGAGVLRAQHIGVLTQDVLSKDLEEAGFVASKSP